MGNYFEFVRGGVIALVMVMIAARALWVLGKSEIIESEASC